MNFDRIFEQYYNLYRAEATTPAGEGLASSAWDDEYTIALRLANEAVNYWANYDNTYWRELFDTNRNDGSGSQTIVTSQTVYDAPDNMQEVGGYIKVLDSNDNVVQRYPIIEPHEAQFAGEDSTYAYFRGNPAEGHELVLNPAPTSTLNGNQIDYVYYKTPTEFTTGTDTTEIKDAYFIIHRMLGQRFRSSRNPYYDSALRDAENSMRIMKMRNDSGSWSNPWKVPDRSGSIWGTGPGEFGW